jgi:uncharacterized protein YkwD
LRALTHGWRIAIRDGGPSWRRRCVAVSIASIALAAAFSSAGAASGSGAQASGCPDAQTSPVHGERFLRALLCLHDAERGRHGMGSLRIHGALRRAAKRHARDLVRRRYFGHVSPAGTNPVDRALAGGYRGARKIEVRENLLTWSTSLTPAEVMRKWMASPPHRGDILHPHWRDVGIALVRASTSSPRGLTVVVEFGRRYR